MSKRKTPQANPLTSGKLGALPPPHLPNHHDVRTHHSRTIRCALVGLGSALSRRPDPQSGIISAQVISTQV